MEEVIKRLELLKEADCKMVKCKIVNKNIELNKKIVELKNNSIPISVIQNKIDELDNELEEKYSAEKISVFSGNTYMEKFKLLGSRQVLQELLEERNK